MYTWRPSIFPFKNRLFWNIARQKSQYENIEALIDFKLQLLVIKVHES